jgi:hypothetical protein
MAQIDVLRTAQIAQPVGNLPFQPD